MEENNNGVGISTIMQQGAKPEQEEDKKASSKEKIPEKKPL